MPTERSPSPLLATLAAAGGLVLLLAGRGGGPAQPLAPARARSPAGRTIPGQSSAGRPGHDPSRRAAVDHGRGGAAASPTKTPARGWWDIVKRAASPISDDRVMTEAAGITFYALLALFPALGALISIYGLFADPAQINDPLAALSGVIPGGG